MRWLSLLRAFVRYKFLWWMSGRGFLVTLTANQAVTPLIGLAVWTTALPGASGISTYYVALLAVQLMTVSYENHTFSEGIYQGGLVDSLLRPCPVVLPTLADNLAIRAWHLLIGLPLLAGVALVAGIELHPKAVILALPALVCAGLLRFLFTYLLSLTAFWTQRAHAVVAFGETLIFLLGGSAAPVTLLPGVFRSLAGALPFHAMLGFPAEIAAGGLGRADLLAGYFWQVVWTGAFAVAGALAWRSGVRRYTAVGG